MDSAPMEKTRNSPAPDFHRLFDAAPGLYLILDRDLKIVAVNRAYAQATQIEPQAVLGRNLFDVFPDNPGDPAADGVRNLRASLARVMRTRQPDAMAIQKYDIRTSDGVFEERYWSPLNVPVLSDDGAVRWILHRVEDVTELARLQSQTKGHDQIAREQQRVIEDLRAANARLAQTLSDNSLLAREHAYLASIVESSGDAIIGETREGIVTSWNRAAEVLFGYRAAEIVGRSSAQILPPERLQEEDSIIARLVRGEVISHFETVRLRKDGKRLQVSLTVSPMHDRAGDIIGSSKIVRDITVQQEVEEKIRGLQADRLFLADLVDSSNDAIVARTNDGRIRSWNRAAELMFGYSAAEMIGQSGPLSPDQQDEAVAVVERLRRGEQIIHYETKRRHKDGSEIPVSFTASLIRNREGEVVGTSGILRDISAQKQTEANMIALQDELAHVGRISAMGQMSVAIAHELNQPLAAVCSYVQTAQRLLADEVPAAPKLRTAREAIEKAAAQTLRAGTIIRSLRDYVEKRDGARSLENLNEVIRQAVTLAMLGHIDGRTRLTIALDPANPSAMFDKVQIQQVLLNVVRNALEAMSDTEAPELAISSVAEGAGTRITVRDTGPGFSPDVAGRLFQPFATTKDDGMGIGLRICRSIMEAHGGTIEATNGNPGAIFLIYLPHGL